MISTFNAFGKLKYTDLDSVGARDYTSSGYIHIICICMSYRMRWDIFKPAKGNKKLRATILLRSQLPVLMSQWHRRP